MNSLIIVSQWTKLEEIVLISIPDISLMGENIIIFSNKIFQVLIFEKIAHYWTSFFLVKYLIGNMEITYRPTRFVYVVNTPAKCWTGVTFGYLSWFPWSKTIISKDYYIRNHKVLRYIMLKTKSICWRITNKSIPLPRKKITKS